MDKIKEMYEKATDVFFKIAKMFDGVSEKLYQSTGVKINVGAIVVGFVLLIIVVIFVKALLGWLWSLL